MALTHALATNNYGESHLIVATSAANGTHTTLASAMADAVSGDTIFLRDSVTENVTLTAGVNIAAWTGGSLNTPTITGTLTMTTAGTCNIRGIRLQTNSAAVLAVTGSAASIVNLNECYLNCTNNTGITFSSSSGSAQVNLNNCNGDLGTTGIGLFAHSSGGALGIAFCFFNNSGASTTANTISAGTLNLINSSLTNPVTSSGTTAVVNIRYSLISVTNTTSFTHGSTSGTASAAEFSVFSSGSASAISVSASCSLNFYSNHVSSSNTNALTGSGTLTNSGTIFLSSSIQSNVTTQTGGVVQGLTQGTAPSAGYVGEILTANATSVAMVSTTAKTITSVSLTPGIWDVTGMVSSTATGGTSTMTLIIAAISATTNTVPGTVGIDYYQLNSAAVVTLSATTIPVRVTLSATTTYYLVANTIFSSTTCPTNGIIRAVRVG